MASNTAPVLGVTGAPAAGKSTFARALAALGARVIDADALGRAALATPAVRAAVVRVFGRGVTTADGDLDRAALARIVFAAEEPRRRLEAIVHPVVKSRIDRLIEDARDDGAPLVVVDCALLFESGLDAVCDATLDVHAEPTARLERARAERGWDDAELAARSAAQLSADEKRRRAGRVAMNDGDVTRLAAEARRVFEELTRKGPSAPTGSTRR